MVGWGGETLSVVEFSVPVQIVAPAFRGVAQSDGDSNRRGPFRTLGGAEQMHPSLGRSASAFLAIAGDAAADDILPVLPAALGDRHHVIEGQLAGGVRPAAVLAPMVVARVDIRPGEGHIIESALDLDVAED